MVARQGVELARGKSKTTDVTVVDIGGGLELRKVVIAKVREQPVNDIIFDPYRFDRLTENIREREAMESIPLVYDDGSGNLATVSGHHRLRAATAAGLTEAWVLVETRKMTPGELASKQIAHNQLVGKSDPEILAELLKVVAANVDDLLRTGLTAEELPQVGSITMALGQPVADFDFRTITFTFLPHQLDGFERIIDRIPPSDLVGVATMKQYDAFTKAVASFIRIKNVRHIGTVLSLLTKMAEQAVAEHEEEPDGD